MAHREPPAIAYIEASGASVKMGDREAVAERPPGVDRARHER
jgi:hypothetical protein